MKRRVAAKGNAQELKARVEQELEAILSRKLERGQFQREWVGILQRRKAIGMI